MTQILGSWEDLRDKPIIGTSSNNSRAVGCHDFVALIESNFYFSLVKTSYISIWICSETIQRENNTTQQSLSTEMMLINILSYVIFEY